MTRRPGAGWTRRIAFGCGCLVHYSLAAAASALAPAPETPDYERDWEVQPGFHIVQDTTGLTMPSSIAFVPRPGSAPKDPLYFVTELRGKIKVVTVDRSVHEFADLADLSFAYGPEQEREFPLPEGQGGIGGICLEPKNGYVFVTFLYRDGGILRNNIVRFQSVPERFSLRAESALAFTDVLRGHKGGLAHQIGNCVVLNDRLYVGVGDAWEPYQSRRVESLQGKLLCLTLDGKPAPENPFYVDDDPAKGANFVWAMGLRNPFSLKFVQGRLFAAENGGLIDRFFELKKAENYLWNGNDTSIAANAAFVWSPSLGPVQMDYCPPASTIFPPKYHGTFFVSLSAGSPRPEKASGIYSLPYGVEENRMVDVPGYFVRYRGPHPGTQIITGLAFGPDGLYFTPLDGGNLAAGPVLKIVHDPNTSAAELVQATNPFLLLSEKGCIACHVLDNNYGFGTAIGPPLTRGDTLANGLLERLSTPTYEASLATYPLGEGESGSYRTARAEVLAATGLEKVRTWLIHFLREPAFDKGYTPLMPDLGLTVPEATVIADYLLEGAGKAKKSGGIRALIRKVFPTPPLGRKHLAMYFAFGLFAGICLWGAWAMVGRRIGSRRNHS